jgi:hypothetical protein
MSGDSLVLLGTHRVENDFGPTNHLLRGENSVFKPFLYQFLMGGRVASVANHQVLRPQTRPQKAASQSPTEMAGPEDSHFRIAKKLDHIPHAGCIKFRIRTGPSVGQPIFGPQELR